MKINHGVALALMPSIKPCLRTPGGLVSACMPIILTQYLQVLALLDDKVHNGVRIGVNIQR